MVIGVHDYGELRKQKHMEGYQDIPFVVEDLQVVQTSLGYLGFD